jgi:chemotaxis protein CheD
MSEGTWAGKFVFLRPGELVHTDGPLRVKTILGSCVAITMRNSRRGEAAIAHCLLPDARRPARAMPRKEAIRYVDTAIELMIEGFASRGARPSDLEVKLFGGADGIGLGRDGSSPYGVGWRNVAAAEAVLKSYGIDAIACDVGGVCGRVIEFHTGSGQVLVKQLAKHCPPAEAEERTCGLES